MGGGQAGPAHEPCHGRSVPCAERNRPETRRDDGVGEFDDRPRAIGHRPLTVLKLEDIKAGALVEGLLPGRPVTVIATIWHGDDDQTPGWNGQGSHLILEINARSGGYDTRIQRTVKENVTQLGFDAHEFED